MFDYEKQDLYSDIHIYDRTFYTIFGKEIECNIGFIDHIKFEYSHVGMRIFRTYWKLTLHYITTIVHLYIHESIKIS